MPDPTRSMMHVDTLMTELTVARIQKEENFIAGNAFPIVSDKKRSGKYAIWDKGDFNRMETRLRAPGSKAPRVGQAMSQGVYYCERWSVATPLDLDDEANADVPLNPRASKAKWLAQQFMMRMDYLWVRDFFQPGLWGTDWDGVAATPSTGEVLQWEQTGATPIANVQALKFEVQSKIGNDPNVMVVGARVHKVLLTHDEIVEKIQPTKLPGISAVQAALAALFGVERYIVGKAIYTTSKRGQATQTFSHIMTPEDVWVGYRPEGGPQLDEESAGYVIAWNGREGASKLGTRVREYRDEEADADIQEGDLWCDMKLTSADCGGFIDGAVATTA